MENVKDAGRARIAALMERILYEVKKVIVGQDHFLERVLVAMLSQGHLLVEGVPGLAKTLTVKTLARTIHGTFQRIQFTPDLVPADLVGTRIFNQKTGEFATALGPVFTNLLLADEINRAPAKVQSALLEVMQERQVTIGGQTHRVPEPFLVMATQNPIETEGTYPLPEAQVDRFMMKVLVGYPREAEEFVIVQRMSGRSAAGRRRGDHGATRRAAAREPGRVRRSRADAIRGAPGRGLALPDRFGMPELRRHILYGASPRAPINLIGARALAYLRGRAWVIPQDVVDLALDTMRHRLVLSYEALAEGVTADGRDDAEHHGPRTAGPCRVARCCMASRRLGHGRCDAEAVLRRIEWTIIRRLDGLLQGDYRTLFHGPGLDLAEVREYQVGDDVRGMDWNVTARDGSPARSAVPRGARSERLVPPRSQPVDRLRNRAGAEAHDARRHRRHTLAPAHPGRQPRRRDVLRRQRGCA